LPSEAEVFGLGNLYHPDAENIGFGTSQMIPIKVQVQQLNVNKKATADQDLL
jgi:hypothetical protein